MRDLNEFQQNIGYHFRDLFLLRKALRHSSVTRRVSRSAARRSFDRLEFLGDRVLNLFVAEMLYKQFKTESEGDLAHRYTDLICYKTCSAVAYEVGLDRFLEVAAGTNFRELRILCDAVEAVLGAMYLDGGEAPCRKFVEQHWHEKILRPVRPPEDAKSTLQELVQAEGKPLPVYTIECKAGSEHTPVYTALVEVMGYPPAHGVGQSKKAAEKAAAVELLKIMRAQEEEKKDQK